VRYISAGNLFPSPRIDAGLDGRREPGWLVARAPPAAVMLSLEDRPEFIIRSVPITPMPTAASTTSAVVSLALDIRITRNDKVLNAVAAPAANLVELRMATSWLGAASRDRSAKRPESVPAAQVTPRSFS